MENIPLGLKILLCIITMVLCVFTWVKGGWEAKEPDSMVVISILILILIAVLTAI